ncbi:unnamed protein product [Adineta steineri]|uniref:G-protein coupled receptors family 1 profile domain-containing protein n=1 Tax=Adineta steineri TaxID=433720 RepID=A0A815CVP6_9BILA|nr:unnamed protein product [Adineta steineri]CAF4045054.1 unnamed protein product [Adineta steineri]
MNSSSILIIELWFIPFDILMIICTIIVILIATIFLIIIILDKTCHTIIMMHVANSCLVELIYAIQLLGVAIFALKNDLQQIQYQDSLCIFRAYIGYVAYGMQNYSYLLQAIYRYITVVYPSYLFYQSTRVQGLLICITWIFDIIYPIIYVIKDQIKYIIDDQMCQMPLRFSFYTIYNAIYVYGIPIILIMVIYFKLLRYVHEMNKHIIPTNILLRAQRELKMIQHIIIIVMILFAIGFPYAIFILMAFFNSVPKYHFRIAFFFVDTLLVLVMIAIYYFTDPLKQSIMKRIKRRPNVVGIIVI